MDVLQQELYEKLLSVAFYQRRLFFKKWNSLYDSEHAFAPLWQKLKIILQDWEKFYPVRLPAHLRFVSILETDYPIELRELHQPPLGLFVQGAWPILEKRVGVVGSRKPSTYSLRMTRESVRQWVQAGASIVSGGALGIDGEAHRACIDFKGKTAVIMGAGHDHWYPARNQKLFEQVLDTGGCLVSEYSPKTEVRPFQFPERNRIIAALSDSLFLAQAHEKSGSLSTAQAALDLGKEVFVLRPPAGDENFLGSRKLIDAGAISLISPSDLV